MDLSIQSMLSNYFFLYRIESINQSHWIKVFKYFEIKKVRNENVCVSFHEFSRELGLR